MGRSICKSSETLKSIREFGCIEERMSMKGCVFIGEILGLFIGFLGPYALCDKNK